MACVTTLITNCASYSITKKARAQGFNRVSVGKFFDLLKEYIDKYKIGGNKLFDVDEIGVTAVAKSLGKILACKGRKQHLQREGNYLLLKYAWGLIVLLCPLCLYSQWKG
ncbi:hypothetical protein QE152_g39127 [Popillia japonica]|uniref:PiggyBac transposable element-derived protein domain-containing protein n=1 Tax=Popillia japonica TaxID=7064 RepID=A0AAW1HVI2_POPJA